MTKLFISYRRTDSRKDVGRLYDRLVDAFGKENVFKDVDSIPAGSDFRGVLAEAVSSCDICLVVIGTQWLNIRDEDGNRRIDLPDDFVRIEIHTALTRDHCLVIPVLVDGVTMPNADDLPIDLRELAFKNAVSVRDDPDFHPDVTKLINALPASDKTASESVIDHPTAKPAIANAIPTVNLPVTAEDRNRQRMLQNVRTFWITGVLDNSFHGAALLELQMREQFNEVNNQWEVLLRTPESPEQTLALGTHIIDIFDKLNGKLLILGDPGGGKTTTLLELARDLLSRADRDDQHAIPVILNLSSWSETRKPIAEWIVDELNGKYQAPRKVAQAWVAGDDLLLLLDGLDEVAAEHRESCVSAINAYRTEHGFVDVVVCSRILDYDALTNKLSLNGAIVLQPLSEAQVDAYFASFGSKMDTVRAMLVEDETLREMSHSPLILNIIALAYQGATTTDLPKLNTFEARRTHLFDVYVRRMYERRLGDKPYSQAQTVHYLSWLARHMKEHAQSLFLIEAMQPTWLTASQQRRFHITRRLVIIPFFMLLFAIPNYLTGPIGPSFNTLSWSDGLSGLVIGALAGWYFTSRAWIHSFRLFVLGSVAVGLYMGIVSSFKYNILWGIIFGTGLTIMSWLMFLLGKALATLFLGHDDTIMVVEKLRFSIQKVRLSIGFLGFLLGIILIFPFRILSLSSLESVLTPQMMFGMIITGLLCGSSFTLLSGLTNEVDLHIRPNQGMWSTFTNANRAFWVMLFGWAVIGSLIIWAASVQTGIVITLATILGFSFGAWFMFGGLSVVEHVMLRRVLTREGAIPANYAQFLDSASALILLRKVGGGYIFVHRLLLEYFAAQAEA
jgi:eukaryotic-like serine/threonine-protein kinase